MLWFFLALLAAFFVAAYFLEMKKLVSEVNQHLVAGSVFLMAGLMLFAFSLAKGFPEIGNSFFPAVACSVTINFAATVLYMRALKITDLSLAMPLIAFTPVFLVFLSPLILGEVPNPDAIAGIILVVAGSYVLNLGPHHKILSPFRKLLRHRGMVYMFIVSILFSFLANFDKMVMLNSDFFFGPSVTFSLCGFAFLCYFFLTEKTSLRPFQKNRKTVLYASLFNFLAIVFTYTAWSLQIVPYVISIQRTSILFSVFFGGVLLHEKGMLHRMSGALLMAAGAAVILLSA